MSLFKISFIEKGIDWIHSRVNDKQFLIFSSILVGVSAGVAAVLLKLFVHFIRHSILESHLFRIDFKYIYLLMPLVGIGITVLIVQRFFKGKLLRGTSNILYSIAKKGSFLPFRHIYSHIITSGITVGFGGSAGLESPIVSTGSAIGSNYAQRYKLSYKDRTLLLAAGAAGGIAGAFNAPIAGVLFALEVLLVGVNITAFIPLLIASASGALISKIILEENILLSFKLRQPFDYYNLPFYIVLGFLAGFLSLYYIFLFDNVERKFRKIKSIYWKWLLGGIFLAIMVSVFPSLFGEGYDSIKQLADHQPELVYRDSILNILFKDEIWIIIFVLLAMMFKAVAVGITLGSGGNGGNFAPSLFVGAYLGFVFASVLKLLGFDNVPIGNLTLVAMAGILTGVFHAPLTGIFLIAEITGGYELIIPLMIVSSISYIVVKYFHPDSLDVKKLKKRGTVISEDKDINILGKINVEALIEKDFSKINQDDTLRLVVEAVKHSKRNTFPVIDASDNLIGVIFLDDIREEVFNHELYDKIIAKELMHKQSSSIKIQDDIFTIMKKFDESSQWNLPVTNKGKYIGFLSKSSILTKYRTELQSSL
ncbi:MAG: chloride channel protein [Bacteroidetes bacterium]|jgi:CIC family chloride channel protein|nr:chloride channel protein [Bacteroidota bacterium]